MASTQPLRLLALPLGLALAACGGSSGAPIGDESRWADDGPASGASADGPGASPTDPGARGEVRITLAGTTAPFAHRDGASGQTPTRQSVAITGLELLRDRDDAAPARVFDRGVDAVEVDLLAGSPTEIARVARGALSPGRYRFARVRVSHVRYRIKARLHAEGRAVDGDYETVHALSEGALVDGSARAKGWASTTFTSAFGTVGPTEHTGQPLPVAGSSGGIETEAGSDRFAYFFPVDVVVTDGVEPVAVDFVVNVHEGFRWSDQGSSGYAPNVFDTTATGYEPVVRFGANEFAVTVSVAR